MMLEAPFLRLLLDQSDQMMPTVYVLEPVPFTLGA